jgi:hypothetical protein
MKKLVILSPADIEYVKKEPGSTFSKKLRKIIEDHRKIKIFGKL